MFRDQELGSSLNRLLTKKVKRRGAIVAGLLIPVGAAFAAKEVASLSQQNIAPSPLLTPDFDTPTPSPVKRPLNIHIGPPPVPDTVPQHELYLFDNEQFRINPDVLERQQTVKLFSAEQLFDDEGEFCVNPNELIQNYHDFIQRAIRDYEANIGISYTPDQTKLATQLVTNKLHLRNPVMMKTLAEEYNIELPNDRYALEIDRDYYINTGSPDYRGGYDYATNTTPLERFRRDVERGSFYILGYQQ